MSACLSWYVWRKHPWRVFGGFGVVNLLFVSYFCSPVCISLTSLPFCPPVTWYWSMCLAESYLTTWWRRAGWPPKRPGSSSGRSYPPLTSATVTPYGLFGANDLMRPALFVCVCLCVLVPFPVLTPVVAVLTFVACHTLLSPLVSCLLLHYQLSSKCQIYSFSYKKKKKKKRR